MSSEESLKVLRDKLVGFGFFMGVVDNKTNIEYFSGICKQLKVDCFSVNKCDINLQSSCLTILYMLFTNVECS